MNKYLSLFIASIVFVSSQLFAQSAEIAPVQLKKRDGAFVTSQKSFDKLAPSAKNLIGKWKCIGAAGYKIIGQCGIDTLEFTKNEKKEKQVDLNLSKRWNNKKTSYTSTKNILEMEFSPWPLYEQKGDVYNYIYRKKLNKSPGVDTEIVLINESDTFMLSDCTSYGNQILICKTKGSPNDYSNDESNIKDMQGLWSVFVRENSKEVPSLVVKPSTGKNLLTQK